MSNFITELTHTIEDELTQILIKKAESSEDKQQRADEIRALITRQEARIQKLHDDGARGLEVASYRAALIDHILKVAFDLERSKHQINDEITLVAVGGYGRGHLNPGSDIDILFLLPKASHSLDSPTSEFIQSLLYLMWDTGFKVGHASRSVNECIKEAKAEQQSKTAMMDARIITGDSPLFNELLEQFEKQCVLKDQKAFFDLRIRDRKSRHKKYSYTVFLQEPHVKESCGGLRDFHNIMWVSRVKRNTSDIRDLSKDKILTKRAIAELEAAYEFLHRVRNELHYHTKSSTDILTLQLQGIVATNFNYPEKSILRRCESFMRDYYLHTRNIFNHTNSLMQIFKLEMRELGSRGIKRFFSPRSKRVEFDGFIARDNLIFPKNSEIFKEDTHRIFRMFQHCQIKGLHMSPAMRKLVKDHQSTIEEKSFRYSKANRETFQAMLQRKGDIAMNLRRMHRVGALGAYLPEFGAMECLVQHEFFHRYTADEHTLRCIDQLDALMDDERQERAIYRKILIDFEDPYALYLALILHDSGRAENVREHIDGSAILASKVCSRLQIKGARRSMITFLVDHHLTFWRFATSRNLDDPSVIEEFASIMRTKERLAVLLLFTYADSNGTNEEAWSPWKESLMRKLFFSTEKYLDAGKEKYQESLNQDRNELYEKVKEKAPNALHPAVDDHFSLMPKRYFNYRSPHDILRHIKNVTKFIKEDAKVDHDLSHQLQWVNKDDYSYTEFVFTCWNKPLLLEKICCALTAEGLSIISADVFTREDNIVCDIFQVCTLDHLPVNNKTIQDRVSNILSELIRQEEYEPSKYLKKKKNYLTKDSNEGGIPFPVIVKTNNYLSDTSTAIEIQALDRIGLLHDLFLLIGRSNLATVNARICTEKGAAMNIIYVTYPDGSKILDQEKLQEIVDQLTEVIN